MGRRREEISLLSSRARALLRFDAYTCVGFFYGTTRVLYCFVFLSLVLIYYIAALYSSFFSFSSKPISSLFDFLSFRYYALQKKRVLLRVVVVVERGGVHFVFSFSSSSFASSLLVSRRRRFIRFARSIGGTTQSPTTGTRSSHGHFAHAQCANRFPHLHRERKRNGTTLSRGTQQPPRHTTVILLLSTNDDDLLLLCLLLCLLLLLQSRLQSFF